MAELIEGGGMLFDSLVYGRTHPGTQQFLMAQLQAPTAALTTAGQSFMAGIHDMYERMSGSVAERMLRAAGRSIRNMWGLDEIRPLNDIGALQHAPLKMQRWLMAEPTVRTRFHQQRVDGYSDSYVDMEPGLVGELHYDYRRVMDGIVVDAPDTDEDGESYWTATSYFEELLPDDADLLLEEQVDILDSWAHAKAALQHGREDPTDRFNASLE